MRRPTTAVVVGLLAALLAATGPATADSTIDEQYMTSRPPVSEPGWISGFYDDGIDDLRAGSVLYGVKWPETQTAASRWAAASLCTSLDDVACKDYRLFDFAALLPECSAKVTTDCIVGVTAISGKGEVNATFVQQFPATGPNDYTGDPAIGLPNGESPSLWKFDGVTHPGGDLFMVSAAVTGWVDSRTVDSQLRLNFYPVSIKSSPGAKPPVWEVVKLDENTYNRGVGDERTYLARGNDAVLQRWPFPTDTKFRVTVRVAKPLTGWLHGRVQNPEIQITTGSFGQQFAITAEPTVVPVLDHWSKFVELPQALQDMLRKERPGGAYYFGTGSETDWTKVSLSYQNGGRTSEETMQKFLLFNQNAKDKSAANKQSWTIRTMASGELGQAGNCLNDKKSLVGVVSTNATVYLAGPPSFDKATQTLNYKVASPHYGRTGDVNVGTYALVMRSDVARCVYGFSDAPISATVSVLSSDGTQQVATTTVNQKDGWLYLTANGFTYSNPTVQVKFMQVQAPTPAKATPVKAAPKKSVTCTKGKTAKTVTGNKCPSGWKKK